MSPSGPSVPHELADDLRHSPLPCGNESGQSSAKSYGQEQLRQLQAVQLRQMDTAFRYAPQLMHRRVHRQQMCHPPWRHMCSIQLLSVQSERWSGWLQQHMPAVWCVVQRSASVRRPLVRGAKRPANSNVDHDSPWMAPIRRMTLSPERRAAPVF